MLAGKVLVAGEWHASVGRGDISGRDGRVGREDINIVGKDSEGSIIRRCCHNVGRGGAAGGVRATHEPVVTNNKWRYILSTNTTTYTCQRPLTICN